MARKIDAGVEIVEVDKRFIAKFFYDGKLQHTTYPQYNRQNAIMLINRKIERFNIGRDNPPPTNPYNHVMTDSESRDFDDDIPF
ncbi:TPA: hypothetical protein ACU203_002153 [Mannheimia haemolytica]